MCLQYRMGYTYAKNQFIVCLKFSDLPRHPIFYLSMLLLWKPNLAYKVKFMVLRGCGRGAQCFPCYKKNSGLHKSQGRFKVNWMPHLENGWGPVPAGEAERFSGVEVKLKSSPGRTHTVLTWR